MGDLKFPSLIIQGIILATNITFIIKGGGYITSILHEIENNN